MISTYGLKFTVLQSRSIAATLIASSNGITALSDCLDLCAGTQYCSAVNFDWSLRQCSTLETWTGSANTSTPQTTPSDSEVAAYAAPPQMEAFNTTDLLCPHPNLSRQKAANGAEFKMICGSDCTGGDYAPAYISSEPEFVSTPTQWAWHADSYEQCMEMCATSHPLCRVFTFAKAMKWINCYLKNATDLVPSGINYFHMHSGVLVQPKEQRVQSQRCSANRRITSSATGTNQTEFTLSCDDFRLLGHFSKSIVTQMHRRTQFECIDACASFTPDDPRNRCIAIVFDKHLDYGWDNCYLKKEIGSGASRSGYTLAYMSSYSDRYTPPYASHKKHLGRGKIAAIVVSVVLVIALLLCFQYWRRSKNARKKKQGVEEVELPLMEPDAPNSRPMASGTSLENPETQVRRSFVRQISSSSVDQADDMSN